MILSGSSSSMMRRTALTRMLLRADERVTLARRADARTIQQSAQPGVADEKLVDQQ